MAGRSLGRICSVLSIAALLGGGFPYNVDGQQVAVHDTQRSHVSPRRVTVDVENALVRVVIKTIADQAGLKPSYIVTMIPGDARVTLRVKDVPVERALEQALHGTGLIARVQQTGNLVIAPDERSSTAKAAVATGEIVGQVTDVKSRRPLPGVNVVLDGRSDRALLTDENGQFRFPGVSAGSHTVAVRMLGYKAQQREVKVIADSTSTTNFSLDASSVSLDQVVVTATGEQRIRELGHVVTRIDADSLVRNSPITSVAELLTARVPGLQVISGNGGTVGGDVALRLRGQTTTALDPQPIVIVDGVRFRSNNAIVKAGSSRVDEDSRAHGVVNRSPLHDINVSDIETIEVVKGPSASTLYGPDAANGVVVITTKRPKAGKAEWRMYLYPRLNSIDNNGQGTVPTHSYYGWGHHPVTGVTVPFSCTLEREAYGECIQDSITRGPTVMSLPDFNMVTKNRPQWHYGGSVSGGTNAMRYFLSAGGDWQVGSLRIPPAAAERLKQTMGTRILNDAIRNPNTHRMITTRANLAVTPNQRTSLGISTSYAQGTQRAMNAFVRAQGGTTSGTLPQACVGEERSAACVERFFSPADYVRTSEMQSHRLIGNAEGSVQITSWLSSNGSLGLDLGWTDDRAFVPAGTMSPGSVGAIQMAARDNTGKTGTTGITANNRLGVLSFRTALGAQYVYTRATGVNSSGDGLAPGSRSISTATRISTSQSWSESASLGSYAEEVIGVNDRIFLTSALRLDGSTSLGDAYRARPFPKVSLSWIVSEEPWFPRILPIDLLRFRTAAGAGGKYPTSAMKIGAIEPRQGFVEGRTKNAYSRSALGNSNLKPERTQEREYGADIAFFSDKVTVDITRYSRKTFDMLGVQTFPMGIQSRWDNVGDVTARGTEIAIGTRLIETKSVEFSMSFNYAFNATEVTDLGASTSGFERIGYPLGALFGRRLVGVADTVGGRPDGVVVYRETQYDTVSRYLGVPYAPRVYALVPTVSLWGGRMRISSSFDRQTGGVASYYTLNICGCSLPLLQRGTDVLDQAIAREGNVQNLGFLTSSDFTRWRELSVTTSLPKPLLRLALLSAGSVRFQVRNMKLWTRFNGGDPESMRGGGTTKRTIDARSDGLPNPRGWTISFDVTP